MTDLNIRSARLDDCPKLIALMEKLAVFEGYDKDFKVTEKYLSRHAFNPESKFNIIVAEAETGIAGILVYYEIPFTYDLKPWLFIKELYVQDNYRNQNIGLRLMQKLSQIAMTAASSRIRWEVLTINQGAQHFYQKLGAKPQTHWQMYQLNPEEIQTLANQIAGLQH